MIHATPATAGRVRLARRRDLACDLKSADDALLVSLSRLGPRRMCSKGTV